LKYSSRPEFTEIGKAYFSGRQHSRRDSGNRIDYRCLVCRHGHLSAVLTPGISKETGRPTWTAPLTVASAVSCTPDCASYGALEGTLHPKLVEVKEADLHMEARHFPDSHGPLSVQGDCASLELICQSVAEQPSLEGRYEVLELNGLTDRVEADDFMKENNLYLEQKVESVGDTSTRYTSNPTKRHRASHLRKQMKMHNFFKIRK
jgi:hypothetical protein